MKYKRKSKENSSILSTSPISDWLAYRYKRHYAPATLENGKMTIFIDGKELSLEEFNKQYPVMHLKEFLACKENPDKSNDWKL